ncbi:hypothetical protein [Micromonospora sp. NPDC049107]
MSAALDPLDFGDVAVSRAPGQPDIGDVESITLGDSIPVTSSPDLP